MWQNMIEQSVLDSNAGSCYHYCSSLFLQHNVMLARY